MKKFSKRIAVIAGTPVDTKMGADFVEAKSCGLAPVPFPVSADCDAQNIFQHSSEEQKFAALSRIFDDARAQKIEDFFVYCNSLSGAFDFKGFAKKRGFGEKVHTPLEIYESLAKSHKIVGILAANNLSALGIESAMMKSNSRVIAVGCANMALVRAVEAKIPPQEIVEKFSLRELAKYFFASGCEAVILGCTHFPYFKEPLQEVSPLPLIDPAEKMLEEMLLSI